VHPVPRAAGLSAQFDAIRATLRAGSRVIVSRMTTPPERKDGSLRTPTGNGNQNQGRNQEGQATCSDVELSAGVLFLVHC
jgi:hypothetical protein